MTRPETAGGLAGVLAADPAVMLILATGGAGRSRGWPTGKTQLAAFLAESAWRSGELRLLAWVTASSRPSVLAGYAEAAAVLGLDVSGSAEQVAGRFLSWLAATDDQWLLVLDDLRDPEDVSGLWPRGVSGRVLATAPGADCVPDVADVRLVEVPVMSDREAIGYIRGQLTADPDQRAGALDLARELGGEPVALAQAAAVIADSDLTCWEYRKLIARAREASGAELPVPELTWRLSAEHASVIAGPGTWPVLVLVSVLDRDGIPCTVLTAPAVAGYLDVRPDEVRTLLLALHQAGLAEIGPAGDPPLVFTCGAVQAAVRTAAEPGLLEEAVRAAADALAWAWSKAPQAPAVIDRFRACAAALRQVAGAALWDEGGCHPLLWLAGQHLDAAGMPGPAAGWWRQLTADGQQLAGTDHQETLAAAGKLASALLAAGQAGDALAWAGHLADARSRLCGPEHPVTITARTLLGQALAAAGKPGDAAQVLAGTAAASERIHGPGSPVTLEVMAEHATTCRAAGLTDEAVTRWHRVLESWQGLLGPADPLVITTGLSLISACLAASQPQQAATVCEQLLDAIQRTQGTGHRALLPVTAALADARTAAGRISEGLRLREEVCTASDRILGPAHPDTFRHRADLARAYWDAGQAGDAITVLTDTIRKGERLLPPGDRCAAELRQALAVMTGGGPA